MNSEAARRKLLAAFFVLAHRRTGPLARPGNRPSAKRTLHTRSRRHTILPPRRGEDSAGCQLGVGPVEGICWPSRTAEGAGRSGVCSSLRGEFLPTIETPYAFHLVRQTKTSELRKSGRACRENAGRLRFEDFASQRNGWVADTATSALFCTIDRRRSHCGHRVPHCAPCSRRVDPCCDIS